MLVIWLVGAAFAEECPEDALGAALRASASLELAYANLDDSGFDRAHAQLDAAIPCIDVEIAPPDAVVIHKAKALASFVVGDPASSRQSWLAVRALQPDWVPPRSIMPEGHPLLELSKPTGDIPVLVDLEQGPPGGWAVDGLRRIGVPDGRAYILQGFDAGGQVVHTGYHYTVAEARALEIELAPVVATDLEPGREVNRKAVRTWGTVGAVVAAGASAGAAFYALDLRSGLEDLDGTDIHGTAVRQRAMVGASVGLGVVAAGGAAVVWAVPW